MRDPISQVNRVVAAFERRPRRDDRAPSPSGRTGEVERPADEVPVSTDHNGPKMSNTPTPHYQKIEDVPSSAKGD